MGEGRIGAGECSAIACAVCSGYKLAIDDKRAIKEARKISAALEIIETQELVVTMIVERLLTIAEADEIKNAWETKHRFKLKIPSFSDVFDCGKREEVFRKTDGSNLRMLTDERPMDR